MLKLHPVFLERDGLSQFVVLPCEEFKAMVRRWRDGRGDWHWHNGLCAMSSNSEYDFSGWTRPTDFSPA